MTQSVSSAKQATTPLSAGVGVGAVALACELGLLEDGGGGAASGMREGRDGPVVGWRWRSVCSFKGVLERAGRR